MTREDVRVETPRETQAPEATATAAASAQSATLDATDASAVRGTEAQKVVFTNVFGGSKLRRPSKIPRLAKQPSSVASTTHGDTSVAGESHAPTSLFRSKLTTFSSTMSVTSAASSRETTPFSSPHRPSSRLRGPTQVLGRKRPRDDATNVTIASVAERLRLHGKEQQHSEDLSVATSHDDTGSQASMSREDESEAVLMASQSSVASVYEDDEPPLEQQVVVAKALQRDLLRDRARLRLKINAMKEDVETYYELLARMEQVTVAVMAQHSEDRGSDSEMVIRLAERIQSIISARRTEGDVQQEESALRSDQETDTCNTAVEEDVPPLSEPPTNAVNDTPLGEHEEE